MLFPVPITDFQKYKQRLLSVVFFLVVNIISNGIAKGQNKEDVIQAIYDTCLYRHIDYWMAYSNKSYWTDSVFIVTKNENYRGSEQVKVSGAEIKYLTQDEIYLLASKGSVGIIRFAPPILNDSTIVIGIVDFTVKKKKKNHYDFANGGGSRHTIAFNCLTGKFEVVFSKESRP